MINIGIMNYYIIVISQWPFTVLLFHRCFIDFVFVVCTSSMINLVQALAAQKFREQKEEERKKRLEELRARDCDRRAQVEERKRQIWEAERDRREAILRKNQVIFFIYYYSGLCVYSDVFLFFSDDFPEVHRLLKLNEKVL